MFIHSKKKCTEHLLSDRDSSTFFSNTYEQKEDLCLLELHSKGRRKTFHGNENDTLVNYPVC